MTDPESFSPRDCAAPPATGVPAMLGPGISKGQPAKSGWVDPRVLGAWRSWLSSLATDAAAARAAAHLYAELTPAQRDLWLDLLAEDLCGMQLPHEAVYGPLLAVECDPERHRKIRQRAGLALNPWLHLRRALVGNAPEGKRVAVLIGTLYLDFVAVLASEFSRRDGFGWVEQLPFIEDARAPATGQRLAGAALVPVKADELVDELAHAVVAHRRSGRPMPELMCEWAELFSPAPGEWTERADG